MFDMTNQNTTGLLDNGVEPCSAAVVEATVTEIANGETKPAKQFKKRTRRVREMNSDGTISALSAWTRTVSISDIHRFMECPGAYLMWAEGDKPGERTVGDAIGQAVHNEIAKPENERLTDVTKLLKSVPETERAQVAEQVKTLIAKAAAAQDRDEARSQNTQKEPEPMVWFDSYTKTWWYAKPDVMSLSGDSKGRYLLIVDEKTTKGRRRNHSSAAFFFAIVARESKALGFTGTIKTVIRYLRDFQGNILEEPMEDSRFVSGRALNERHEQELHGIQATIKKMDETWESGRFALRDGGHCRGCQFRMSCPKNREWLEARQAERLAAEGARADVANDGQSVETQVSGNQLEAA